MRMTGVATPFTTYAIPPNAPEPVVEAWSEMTRIGILFDDARDDLKAAKSALVAAQAEDVKAVAADDCWQRAERSDSERASSTG